MTRITREDGKGPRNGIGWLLLIAATLLLGMYLRGVGAFRGLGSESVYHPDEPKQVSALFNYLHGRYVWYTGSLFYDGYPYGLNHVDEWMLRPVLLVRNACLRTLHGTEWSPCVPSRSALYYWARTLRIIYGVAVMLIACATARRLFRRQSAAWLVLLLTAVAPLSFCVTHFATGDIGVDLFGGLALLLLVLFARRPAFMLAFAAGAATGIAFGCKYNGILCGLAIAIYALLHLVSRWRIGTFLATSAASLGGCVVGIVASTPALLIDFKRTRDDIFANFQFIKDYSVPDEERALPFLQKAWLGLTRNTADIVGSLGWVVMFLAAVGLVATIVSYARRPKHGDFESNQNTVLRARLAVILFPFIALFMSLAGKLEVQPFHFSYLQVPFVLAAAAGVVALGRGSWRGARLLAGIAAAAAVVEFGLDAAYERFYWQREDNVTFVNEFPSR